MVVGFYERMKKADTIPATRMRMQDSHMPDMLPDTPPVLGAAVLLLVPAAVVVAALDVTVLVPDAVVVPEFATDVEAVEDTVRVTSPEEALSTRMLAPEGRAELATRTDVDTPETTEATRTEALETAAEALEDAAEDAADTAEVAMATFDETTEAKLDRALVGFGMGMGAVVAVAATDARDVADALRLLTPDKADETIAEFAAKHSKLVKTIAKFGTTMASWLT